MNAQNLNLAVLYNDQHMAELYDALDELHSAVCDNRLERITALNKRELVALLRDVIYTAQETIDELNQMDGWPEPVLRLVERPQAQQRPGA
jgi:hypothetical protein